MRPMMTQILETEISSWWITCHFGIWLEASKQIPADFWCANLWVVRFVLEISYQRDLQSNSIPAFPRYSCWAILSPEYRHMIPKTPAEWHAWCRTDLNAHNCWASVLTFISHDQRNAFSRPTPVKVFRAIELLGLRVTCSSLTWISWCWQVAESPSVSKNTM